MKKFVSSQVSLTGFLFMVNAGVMAGNFDARIPMSLGAATTYYVQGHFGNLKATDFMVDTGSGFLTINQLTLNTLLQRGLAIYKRDLSGMLADGTEMDVPVYEVAQFSIGPCLLKNVEAAVFPSTQRQILGLNVLNQSAPFIFSVNPPELVLSHCTGDGLAGTVDSSLATRALRK
jgi:predicted aspartyl protease